MELESLRNNGNTQLRTCNLVYFLFKICLCNDSPSSDNRINLPNFMAMYAFLDDQV